MKRGISTLIVCTAILCLLPTAVFAYDTGKMGVCTVVSTGSDHTAAIDSNGSLWMWGANDYGQLGTGTTTSSNTPVNVMNNVATVSLGNQHTAVIKTDGSLWMWGRNSHGQLGNGGTGNDGVADGSAIQTIPVKVMDDVASVSLGECHTAALKADGSLWMWGANYAGQLGNGGVGNDNAESGGSTLLTIQTVPIKVMDDVAAVSSGFLHTAVVKTDGSLWMWGSNSYGELGIDSTEKKSLVPVKVMDNVASVSCGQYRTGAIKTDGTLWMWGENDYGELGNGKKGNAKDRSGIIFQTIPIEVMDDVTTIYCGGSFTAALKNDGTMWMWGSNRYGQLGNGGSGNAKDWAKDTIQTIPIQVMEDVAIISGNAAVKTDGTLWMWGNNHKGQLGNGGTAEKRDWQSIPYQTTPVKSMDNVSLSTAFVPFSISAPTSSSNITAEYIYDISDSGEGFSLDTSRLDSITDSTSAISAVQTQIQSMTTMQKNSATGIDLATLYAETAVSKAARKAVTGKEIIINKAAVTDLEAEAAQTSAAVETALVNGGVTTARLVSNTITLTTDETGEITIKIGPDILTTKVDKIRVETPTYAITLKVADLKEDLTEILTITAEDVGSGFAPGNQNKKTTVKVNLPKGKTTNPVTLSLPKDGDDTTYQAVVKTDGSATSSKYNPATTTMDGKVNTSGSYTVQTNQKDFTDIANKSAEMQKAIRYLASKGIINGTSATEFSPDGSINRAEIAALLVRALGKLDNSAANSFTDVTNSDWYYSAAGSSQKAKLINGYEDGTFRGTTTIAKDQILAVSSRVLKNEMGYKEPSDPSSYLTKYSDTVVAWAQPEIALATKENLVVYRYDGTFKGESNMTRGDAAIIIYRLFQKIW